MDGCHKNEIEWTTDVARGSSAFQAAFLLASMEMRPDQLRNIETTNPGGEVED